MIYNIIEISKKWDNMQAITTLDANTNCFFTAIMNCNTEKVILKEEHKDLISTFFTQTENMKLIKSYGQTLEEFF